MPIAGPSPLPAMISLSLALVESSQAKGKKTRKGENRCDLKMADAIGLCAADWEFILFALNASFRSVLGFVRGLDLRYDLCIDLMNWFKRNPCFPLSICVLWLGHSK